MIVRSLILLVCSLYATLSVADAGKSDEFMFSPYLGVDYQYQHMKANGSWVDVMPSNLQNKAIFLGLKYHKHFGIELGYYSTLRKATETANLNTFNGLDASSATEIHTLLKTKGFSAEWNVYAPLDPHFNIFGIAGLVTVHPSLKLTATGTADLANALRLVSFKNRTIVRLGLGAQLEYEHWGARAKLLWDHTQKLYLNTNNAESVFATINRDAFKQTAGLVLGVYYRF